MKIIGVISAKLNPEGRVPNKILLPLAGKTMLEHHIERMQAVEGLDGVFVATSRWPGNEKVVPPICDKCGVGWMAGSENDVIKRHIVLCEKEGADAVIRMPCDSPLFYIDAAINMAQYYRKLTPGYVYVKGNLFTCGTMPELVSYQSFKKAHDHYQGPAVTLPIWEHRQEFDCAPIMVEGLYHRTEYKLDVDTPMDYVVMSHIYAALYDGRPIPLKDVYRWLDDHPEIARFNSGREHSAINRRFTEAQRHATA